MITHTIKFIITVLLYFSRNLGFTFNNDHQLTTITVKSTILVIQGRDTTLVHIFSKQDAIVRISTSQQPTHKKPIFNNLLCNQRNKTQDMHLKMSHDVKTHKNKKYNTKISCKILPFNFFAMIFI